jgi:hypothetical protein
MKIIKLLITCLVITFVGINTYAEIEEFEEYNLKAIFLYNLTRFTTWPKSVFESSDSKFNICIFGNDPFNDSLKTTVDNESIGEHDVIIKHISTLNDIRICQTLFLVQEEAYRQLDIISEANKYKILTVGDNDDFIKNGGMIEFFVAENKVRFSISPQAINENGLNINARVLAIANIMDKKTK